MVILVLTAIQFFIGVDCKKALLFVQMIEFGC